MKELSPRGSEFMDKPNHDQEVRLAVESDIDRIHLIISCAYEKYLSRMDRPPEPMIQDYKSRVNQGNVWVIGEPIIGLICLIPEGDSVLIEDIAVLPSKQRKGNGRKQIAFAENEASRLHLDHIWLFTNEAMFENIDFYRKLGYTEVERRIQKEYRRVLFEKNAARTA